MQCPKSNIHGAAKNMTDAKRQEVEDESDAAVLTARGSCRVAKEDMVLTNKDDYEFVRRAIAANVKIGPFIATSGLELPYYLNAATSLLDKHAATPTTRMVLDLIQSRFCAPRAGRKLLVVGIEMAGGVMAGQCTAIVSMTHPQMMEQCDFVYCRKTKKTSGTMQQLEGPSFITGRTPESEMIEAVWLDDANSSGGVVLQR
jgi:orotate phosphoribosyltransferase